MFGENDNRSTASELDGLSDPARKETEEILNEIEQEEKQELGKKPPEDGKPKPEEKKEETPDKKPEERKPADERKPEEPPAERRDSKFVPRYVHKITEDQKEKLEREVADLKKIIEDSKGKGPAEEKPTAEQQADLEKEVAALAEEHKLDPKLVKSLVDLGMKYGGKLPAEVTEKLAFIDKAKAEAEVVAEEAAYNKAFDEHVIPLIKEEYGDLPEDTIQAIRELMKEKAYSEQFAKTPYSVIFKGVDDFRKFSRPPAKSGEGGRGGHERQGDGAGGGDDFENVTEEDIEKMDPATFDRYSEWVEGRERGRR